MLPCFLGSSSAPYKHLLACVPPHPTGRAEGEATASLRDTLNHISGLLTALEEQPRSPSPQPQLQPHHRHHHHHITPAAPSPPPPPSPLDARINVHVHSPGAERWPQQYLQGGWAVRAGWCFTISVCHGVVVCVHVHPVVALVL